MFDFFRQSFFVHWVGLELMILSLSLLSAGTEVSTISLVLCPLPGRPVPPDCVQQALAVGLSAVS